MEEVNELLNGYFSAILFSETDLDTEEPLDQNYSISDFDKETVESSKKMLSTFYTKNKKAIEDSGLDLDTIGNDVWYTRAGHGAGFFDHNLDSDVEEKLTNGAKALGEYPTVESYDGKISVSGGRVFKYKDGGGVREYKGLSNKDKFIADQLYYVISLKSISEKKNTIKNSLLPNINNYNLDEMTKKITKGNLEYALQQKSISDINRVLKTSINAFRNDKMKNGGGVEWDKDSDSIRTELGEFRVRITPQMQKGYYDVYVSANKKEIGKKYDVYGIANAKDIALEMISNSNKYAKGSTVKGGGVKESDLLSLEGHWNSYNKGEMSGKQDEGYITIKNEKDLNDYIKIKIGDVVKDVNVIEKGKNYPYNRSNPYSEDTYLVTLKNGTTFEVIRSYGSPNWSGNVNYKEQIKINNISVKFAKGSTVNKYKNGGGIDINELNMPVIRTQFEDEEYEFKDGGNVKVGDKVILPEIKMRDGKIQFEKVENGEVLYIENGIYGVLNPKTKRIHQVSLNQIKFENGGTTKGFCYTIGGL